MSENEKTTWTFSDLAREASCLLGTPYAFAVACAIVLIWGLTGPVFGYSDTWQLIINTGTTIVTFLMVFLIQNTQNRDMAAIHLKLDELIRANEGARNRLLTLEDMTDEELTRVKSSFSVIADRAPEKELLRDAADDLAAATDEIEDATEKVSAVADGSLKVVEK